MKQVVAVVAGAEVDVVVVVAVDGGASVDNAGGSDVVVAAAGWSTPAHFAVFVPRRPVSAPDWLQSRRPQNEVDADADADDDYDSAAEEDDDDAGYVRKKHSVSSATDDVALSPRRFLVAVVVLLQLPLVAIAAAGVDGGAIIVAGTNIVAAAAATFVVAAFASSDTCTRYIVDTASDDGEMWRAAAGGALLPVLLSPQPLLWHYYRREILPVSLKLLRRTCTALGWSCSGISESECACLWWPRPAPRLPCERVVVWSRLHKWQQQQQEKWRQAVVSEKTRLAPSECAERQRRLLHLLLMRIHKLLREFGKVELEVWGEPRWWVRLC